MTHKHNDDHDGRGADDDDSLFGCDMFDDSEAMRGTHHNLTFSIPPDVAADYLTRKKELEVAISRCSSSSCPLPAEPQSVFSVIVVNNDGAEEEEKEHQNNSETFQLCVSIHSLPAAADAGLKTDLTGFALFPETTLLCEFLIRNASKIRGSRLLEVGCGLAAPSHVALALGAKEAVCSDGCEEVLRHIHHPLLKKQVILWTEDDEDEGATSTKWFDVVLGSGIAYSTAALPKLVATVRRFLKPGGLFICGFKRRQVSLEQLLDITQKTQFDPAGSLVTSEEEELGVYSWTSA